MKEKLDEKDLDKAVGGEIDFRFEPSYDEPAFEPAFDPDRDIAIVPVEEDYFDRSNFCEFYYFAEDTGNCQNKMKDIDPMCSNCKFKK